MANAYIAVQKDKTISVLYISWDGYNESGVGNLIAKYLSNPDKVKLFFKDKKIPTSSIWVDKTAKRFSTMSQMKYKGEYDGIDWIYLYKGGKWVALKWNLSVTSLITVKQYSKRKVKN